jgi:U3 small nucleolar ribonucleoprotein protein IMP4
MLQRQVRERREYLYRKSLEGAAAQQYEKKRKIKEAVEEGRAIPTELADEAIALHDQAAWDGAALSEAQHGHEDDEYARAGVEDPRVLVTSSRDPSSRLGQFIKELRLVFPGAERLNRGSYTVKDLMDFARRSGVTDLVIAHEHRGDPDGIIVCHLPYGPTAYFGLHNCVLRHDIPDCGTVSEAVPHLILDGFKTKLGERTAKILKYLFPVPRPDSTRVMTFANNEDYISFRHHVFEKRGHKDIALKEVGPRFEMKLYQIRLGTIDQPEAEKEYILRPFLNSSKKRQKTL